MENTQFQPIVKHPAIISNGSPSSACLQTLPCLFFTHKSEDLGLCPTNRLGSQERLNQRTPNSPNSTKASMLECRLPSFYSFSFCGRYGGDFFKRTFCSSSRLWVVTFFKETGKQSREFFILYLRDTKTRLGQSFHLRCSIKEEWPSIVVQALDLSTKEEMVDRSLWIQVQPDQHSEFQSRQSEIHIEFQWKEGMNERKKEGILIKANPKY